MQHLIKEGGLKRGELITIAAGPTKPTLNNNDNYPQPSWEHPYAKQDYSRIKQT